MLPGSTQESNTFLLYSKPNSTKVPTWVETNDHGLMAPSRLLPRPDREATLREREHHGRRATGGDDEGRRIGRVASSATGLVPVSMACSSRGLRSGARSWLVSSCSRLPAVAGSWTAGAGYHEGQGVEDRGLVRCVVG